MYTPDNQNIYAQNWHMTGVSVAKNKLFLELIIAKSKMTRDHY